jgi:hypothetical protein
MMQTADLGEGNNVADGGKLHATRPWAVFVEREVCFGVMMILKIARQYAAHFSPIAGIGTVPLVLVVRAGLNIKTMTDFTAAVMQLSYRQPDNKSGSRVRLSSRAPMISILGTPNPPFCARSGGERAQICAATVRYA